MSIEKDIAIILNKHHEWSGVLDYDKATEELETYVKSKQKDLIEEIKSKVIELKKETNDPMNINWIYNQAIREVKKLLEEICG